MYPLLLLVDSDEASDSVEEDSTTAAAAAAVVVFTLLPSLDLSIFAHDLRWCFFGKQEEEEGNKQDLSSF